MYKYRPGTLNPSYGVYIQDTDGYFMTEDEWSNLLTPNGVAVVSENCSFIIALQCATGYKWHTNGSSSTVAGVTNTFAESDAKKDYDGDAQTTALIEHFGSAAEMASYCRNFTFPNGQKGYLGAAGEWNIALKNKTAIHSAFRVLGIYNFISYNYPTSTDVGGATYWAIFWNDGTLEKSAKGNTQLQTRPFATI